MKYLSKDDEYYDQIKSATEKMHGDAEEMRETGESEKFIEWDELRDDYMCAGVSKDLVEEKCYKEKRSNLWKEDINQRFCSLKYSEWLFSWPKKGVRLVVDIVAARKQQLMSLKKISSTSDKQSTRLRRFSECFSGKLKKELIQLADMQSNILTFVAGQIALDSTLPIKHKAELLGVVEEFVVVDSEEDEDL